MNLGDIKYFKHGTFAVKCVVEEIINHYTKNGLIEKIIVRPYGLKDHATIDAKDVYDTLEQAKYAAMEEVTKTYTKENISNNYQTAKQQMQEKFDKALADFDENLVKVMDAIEQATDEYYDEVEAKYQEELVSEKSVE
jgi:TRAP-type C4-dicarboxylate transport system substrate-binding protein